MILTSRLQPRSLPEVTFPQRGGVKVRFHAAFTFTRTFNKRHSFHSRCKKKELRTVKSTCTDTYEASSTENQKLRFSCQSLSVKAGFPQELITHSVLVFFLCVHRQRRLHSLIHTMRLMNSRLKRTVDPVDCQRC